MIFGIRSNGKEHGVVMTRIEVVSFMLDICGYASDRDLSDIRVLEPAAGEGVFVLECIRRLHESSIKFGFDFSKSLKNLKAIEIEKERAEHLQKNISNALDGFGIKKAAQRAAQIVVHSDYLLSNLGVFDVIAGNPPYIRNEKIPLEKKRAYQNKFPTFKHRSDIYIAFFEKSLRSLTTRGRLCFICSDRWMKNTYGLALRKLIASSFGVPVIVNLNRADAFAEKVYGYPSIIEITSRPANSTCYFEIRDLDELKQLNDTLKSDRHIEGPSPITKRIPQYGEPWFFDDSADLEVNQFPLIEQQGFRIGIGVATGSDEIFIGPVEQFKVEKEVLLPIVLSQDIRDGKIKWSGNYLINPFDKSTGKQLDLNRYPKLKAYLYAAKARLEKRHVSKKNPRFWYRTIDKVIPELRDKPKLLLPDIKKNQVIALEEGRYYPHHNIYYIHNETTADLKLLGAILMSDFVLKQMQNVSTLMHGGFVRWQSQNLRRIRVPAISQIPQDMRKQLLGYFDTKNIEGINNVVSSYVAELQSKNSIVGTIVALPVSAMQTRIDSW